MATVEQASRADRIIRIDAEVYAGLQQIAQGFETPNDVLRRMLELAPKVRRRRNNTP